MASPQSCAVRLSSDFVRFGSPTETGLRHRLGRGPLAKLRDEGLFSLVHVPDNVALFLGGGSAATCGYRYAMDFVPFVFALVAIALKDRFGNLEKVSIGLSVAFVTRAPARRCSPAL